MKMTECPTECHSPLPIRLTFKKIAKKCLLSGQPLNIYLGPKGPCHSSFEASGTPAPSVLFYERILQFQEIRKTRKMRAHFFRLLCVVIEASVLGRCVRSLRKYDMDVNSIDALERALTSSIGVNAIEYC